MKVAHETTTGDPGYAQTAMHDPAELHLLLDWQRDQSRPGLLTAIFASLFVNLVLFTIFLIAASAGGRPILSGSGIDLNLRERVMLVAPRLQLTQKAPNQAQVAKEVNLDSLTAKPAQTPHVPAPLRPVFHAPPTVAKSNPKPAAPALAEPPKVTADSKVPLLPAPGVPNAPPPLQIQPEEKPKLALQNVGSSSLEGNQPTGRIALPKTSVDEAIRSVVRGGGEGGIAVGDVEQPASLRDTLRSPGLKGQTQSRLELLSDPQGVDFKPYLIRILATVRRNWFAIIPESARLGRQGRTTLQFVIDRNGNVPKVVIAMPSGAEALDRAAVAGISASVPFPPLPSEFHGSEVRLQFSFTYNTR